MMTRCSTLYSRSRPKSHAAPQNTVPSFQNKVVTAAGLALAGAFAARAGGIAADAWAALPESLAELSAADAVRLLTSANDFLERGGGAALHILIAGGEILCRAPEIFDEWISLLSFAAAPDSFDC